MKDGRVVIIGGDAAGMSAAAKIRREQPERDILVLEKTDYTSYSACGIPYFISGMVDNFTNLIARTPETFRKEYGIDVRTAHEVVEIDPADHRVRIHDKSNGREFSEAFDQLLIATGAQPLCPELPGISTTGVFGLSTLASGKQVYDFIQSQSPRRAVIVGGGYIGLEMAEALTRRGMQVSLIQRSPQVMETLDPDMGALVSDALNKIGVNLFLEENFVEIEAADGRVKAVVSNKRSLPADIVILGLGTRPNSRLAAEAGIELGIKNAIRVDGRMCTSSPGILAAGDCAATTHRVSGREVHIALGTIANKQGVVAGTNLAGGQAWFPGVVGTAVSKICDVEVARTGLQEKELCELGIDYAMATIEANTRAGYFPGAGKITVKMFAEKKNGRLLGAQIVGMEGAAKRIDVVATALTASITVADIIDLDLSYAPPFSPVWDPIQTAARQLVKKL